MATIEGRAPLTVIDDPYLTGRALWCALTTSR
jgi:hypothetical protein